MRVQKNSASTLPAKEERGTKVIYLETISFRMDKQWGPTVQHRELYPFSWNRTWWKRVWEKECIRTLCIDWVTMLYSKVTQSYIHTCTFFLSYYLPSCSITRDWIEFPVLYSRTSLLIHSKWNSLPLPTPNSPSISLPPPTPWQPQVYILYVCESVSVLYAGSFVLCFRFHI